MDNSRVVTHCASVVIALLLCVAGTPGAAGGADGSRPRPGDWPQFRGPERTGVSRQTGLLKTWPAGGPRLAWKATKLGEGYSAPSVAHGKVFGMSYRGADEVVWALAEADGKELWSTRTAQANRRIGYPEGSRCTPTVDGGHLYALGVSGHLVCLVVADGKLAWEKSLVRDFRGRIPDWGYSESPLVDGEKVIVTPGQDTATIVALNKRTGQTLWRCEVPGAGQAQYSSVMVASPDGHKQYIQILLGRVVGVSASEGRLLWQWDKPISPRYNCASVIVQGDRFFAAGFHTAGGVAKIARDGGAWRVEEAFVDPRHKNHSGGMVLVDGYLYGDHDGGLCCSEFATGRVVWEDRRPSATRAKNGSVACADGRLYYRREGGMVDLIEATPKGFSLCGQFSQPDRSAQRAFPPPVVANGKLYLRDQDVLLCYDVQQK